MNANRMKYASTPTYGMQKRGFFKKQSAQKAPEAPDFSQVPEAPMVAAPQQLFSVPQAGFPQPPFQPVSTSFSQQTYFPQNLTIPPMQPMPQTNPYAQNGFMAAPSMPPSMPMMGGSPLPNAGQPLGNSAPPINPVGSNPYSPRSQGYVPPQTAQKPQQQPIQPSVRPAAFAQAPQQQPMFEQPAAFSQPMYQNQAAPFFQPMQQPAPSAVPPQQAAAQQPFNLRTPPASAKREPVSADQLWSVFLFGLLPLLFIPCLFVPSAWNALRFLFIGCTVCGLGAMWYRQMYGSATRLIVSIVYVALCILTIAMMMQGGRDVQQTNSLSGNQPQAQQSTAPDDSASAAVAPTEEIVAPTPEPTLSGPSEAEQRLNTFMLLWQGMNTPEMVNYVQPSWASQQSNASTKLFQIIANRTPEEFTLEDISGSDSDSSRTITMTVLINKNNGKDPSLYRFMVLMVREGGEWYVDPNSIATSVDVAEDDELVVNNSQASGLATEPPRTTVTPAPPSDTTLYYNVNGGSFFHMDANCESVAEQYRPLTGTFTYGELNEYMNGRGLQPCLRCGAPTKTLEDAE